MKILIIANYVSFPDESGNCRFMYLADNLSKKNTVEIITSRFSHIKKVQRETVYKDNKNIKVTLIDEPGYKKNVTLKRIYSHKVLSQNLKRYLNNLEYTPDVIYCAVPSLDFAKVAVKYASKKNIRFILDIQDLWPEAFKMALNIPVLSDILFYPMKLKANYIYSHSNNLVAVSETYINRALKVNKKYQKGLSVFLGTDLKYFDECKKKYKLSYNDNYIRVVYLGTLGTSYDINSVIDAIKILNDKKIKNIKLIVMGDGPLKNSFELYAKEKNILCEFTGRLDYPHMVGILSSCDIAINPIVGKSVASIINKVGDYAAAGVPVINTQNSDEYRELIDKYCAGLNCENGNPIDIASKLEKLIKNKELRLKYGKGNRILAEEKFDRKTTYKNIIKVIEGDNDK